MARDASLSEVGANLRYTLVGVLRTFAAPLAGGPLIGGVGELFCQWADDVYHPDTAAFTLAFGPGERAALAAFNVAFLRASASLSAAMPLVEAYIGSAAGAELAEAAATALRSLGEAPDAEPSAAPDRRGT